MEQLKNINKTKILMGIILLSFCLPKLNVISIGTINIKLYRALIVMCIVMLILKKKIKIPSKILFIFLIYMIFVSVISAFSYGIERLMFDYIFSFLILITVYNLGKNIEYYEWIDLIQKVATISLILVLVNIVKNKDTILFFINNQSNQHPEYKSIFTGGQNLEATWTALFSFFFINKPKRGYLYLSGCLLISILLTSRVGMIIDIMGFIFLILNQISNLKRNGNTKKILFVILMLVITLSIIVVVFAYTGIADNMIDRLVNIGKDGGSQGRIRMWKYVGEACLKNPFGYGAGNAILAVKNVSNLWYGEDNVHNLFFQMLLDFGIIGLIFYCTVISIFLKREWRKIIKNPIVAYLVAYLIISLIQFKGAEIITFYILGIYLLVKNKENDKKGKELIGDGRR